MRVYNFSAGPAMLPLEALQRAQSELTDWQGSGMSVVEVSHRGKAFVACAAQAELTLRDLLAIPENYRVLFLQGGASAQFAAVPMNLTSPGDTVAYLKTGSWSGKAISAARAQELDVAVIADEAARSYTTVPAPGSYALPPSAAYLHYTPNETIGGVEFDYIPEADGVPLIADMSSTILSQPIDVSRYGVIYAGAQKNMGPSGLCVAIVRDDLLGHARPTTPSVLDFAAMAASDSMLNTPPTFAVYLLGLILEWLEQAGGLASMATRNRAKADALYGAIDASPFYSNPVALNARSRMNIPFTLADASLDGLFLAGAESAGLTNLKGHRSVGGMRASIYNAMPLEGVKALIDFMAEFEARHA
ncbi:MAG: 3-phosphoserine/phosphohydroxythreonine transaminase [Bifidobacteriaceae bacterium]|jgi:phosphoserine aminotransferase|nr:3-phosphoserine/phosphohydroxythreonine transaminase [Bifidobacteriaceae bacterium]